MKFHLTKEESFKRSGLPKSMESAFFKGWYAAGHEINEGIDSDVLQEQLSENDFLENTMESVDE